MGMKFIHTSDWHIGQRFYRYDRDDEHRHFFRQLVDIMSRERPDALLVSGDIFDTATPSAQAQRMFVYALMDLHSASPLTRIVITSGNHDSGSRIDSLRRLWAEVGVDVVGAFIRDAEGLCDPQQFIIDLPGKGVVAAVPFISGRAYPPVSGDDGLQDRQKAFFQGLIGKARSVAGRRPVAVMAHMAISGCAAGADDATVIGGIETADIKAIGDGYDYLALGHIHKPQWVGRGSKARYCGSPFAMSFAETHPHCVDIVEITETGDAPAVRHEAIAPLRELLTIPEGGAPLDAALEAFANLDDACQAYVRLLIEEEGLLPADADDRANAIAEGKACRLCEIKKAPKAEAERGAKAARPLEIDEIRNMAPIDIAAEAWERLKGEALPKRLKEMLANVIATTLE